MPRPSATALTALALCALGAGQQLSGQGPTLELAAVLLGTASTAQVARLPVPVALAVGTSVAAQALVGDPQPVFASFLALLVAAYGLGRRCRPALVATGLALLAAGIAVMVAVDPSLRTPAEVAIPAVYLAASVAVGRVALGRQRASDAQLVAEREAAAERGQAALAEQRAAIAREMHDVVAHSLSLVVVQAEAAAAVATSDPERSRQLVEGIAVTGRQALLEMRRALGVLRGPAELLPQPGLADLESLVEPVRSSGTEVRLDLRDGARCATDPGVELAAYRVVQEAVTNALRHGRAGRVDVTVEGRGSALHVTVDDDGRGADAPGAGHGLVGMRERVRAYGGEVAAGPRDGGGWRVHAVLPLAAP